jgi:hypothetical protein
MTSRTDKMSASNSRGAYMREYRKRKRLEGDKCNIVKKRTKLNAERHRKAKLRKRLRKIKHHNLVIVVLHI